MDYLKNVRWGEGEETRVVKSHVLQLHFVIPICQVLPASDRQNTFSRMREQNCAVLNGNVMWKHVIELVRLVTHHCGVLH